MHSRLRGRADSSHGWREARDKRKSGEWVFIIFLLVLGQAWERRYILLIKGEEDISWRRDGITAHRGKRCTIWLWKGGGKGRWNSWTMSWELGGHISLSDRTGDLQRGERRERKAKTAKEGEEVESKSDEGLKGEHREEMGLMDTTIKTRREKERGWDSVWRC